MDSRNLPFCIRCGNLEPNATPVYYRVRMETGRVKPLNFAAERALELNAHGRDFEFCRFRFHFRATDAVHFPAGKSANVVRGSFGMLLRDTVSAPEYARLFEPGARLGRVPSGLGDWPRPFLFRAAHLDGLTVKPGSEFYFDLHVFDLRERVLSSFQSVFARVAGEGLGPGRGRAELERVESLGLGEEAAMTGDAAIVPSRIDLTPDVHPVRQARLQFRTPTELKAAGSVTSRPEFGVLFSRLRDRLSTLRALYGAGPLDIDFRAMGERADTVLLRHCELRWERVERKSGRTGQVHPIGGFTGFAEYEGELAEFLPWLRAARWVGVGRQTVWGKGDVRVMH